MLQKHNCTSVGGMDFREEGRLRLSSVLIICTLFMSLTVQRFSCVNVSEVLFNDPAELYYSCISLMIANFINCYDWYEDNMSTLIHNKQIVSWFPKPKSLFETL